MFRKFGDHIKQAFRYFTSNKIMSMASVGVLAACLLIIGSLYLVSVNVQANLSAVENENEIVMFIDDDADKSDVDELYEEISSISNIRTVNYFTKDQALESYMEDFEDESELFEELIKNNPLPQYFTVTLNDIELFDETLEKLQQVPQIYKIRSQEQLVDTLVSLGNAVRNVTYWVMAILLLAALFIIINTVRMASFYFRRQINIMKYVGASNSYIRIPFILEGAIIGILAGFIAFVMQSYAYSAIFNGIVADMAFIKVIPYDSLRAMILNVFVLSGTGIGIIGSGFSIGKYLKV